MEKISVIIPVYRVEQYLRRCVDSVLRQTWQQFEIILVDDGSPDGSPAICDEYADRDARVRVIHQKNAGLSAARNAGLDWMMEHSESRWLMFLDSDDWLHPETLERMLQAVCRLDVQVCVCNYEHTAGPSPRVTQEQMIPQLWTIHDFYEEKELYVTIACAKLYSRECFREIRYPVGKLHEDEFVTYRILFAAEKLAWIPAPFYAYYNNPESIMRRAWSPRRLDAWEALEQQLEFFRQRKEEKLFCNCLRNYMNNAFNQMEEIRDGGLQEQYGEEYARVREKTRSLLAACHRKGIVHFYMDLEILMEFYPVRTVLWRCWLAIRHRLHLYRKGTPLEE